VSRLLLVAFLLGHTAAAAAAQQPDAEPPRVEDRLTVRRNGDDVVLSTDGRPVSLAEFTRRWSDTTGRSFTFAQKGFENATLLIVGQPQAPAADADWLFESILVRAGFALIASGPPSAKLFAVDAWENSRLLRSSAQHVPAAKVGELERKPAQVFSTVFTLKRPSAETRNMLQQFLNNRAFEFVSDVDATNAISVCGFGPTLANIAKMIEDCDRNPPVAERSQVFTLMHAVAGELAPVIEAATLPTPQRFNPNVPQPPRPAQAVRVVADPRMNAIVAAGTEEQLAIVAALVKALDAPVKAK
jgi:hypothetical protein